MAGQSGQTLLYHFTHIRNLRSIVEHGLLADTAVHAEGLLGVEVGAVHIKDRRSRRQVPVPPGGVVADYVPFYFAPRSPMMFSIHRGNVPTYTGGCRDLLYLVTTVDRMHECGGSAVFTDRNAVLGVARFSNHVEEMDDMIDWDLMAAKMWNNTDELPDRKERRQAECLVHGEVPWSAITAVAARGRDTADAARQILADCGRGRRVDVRPEWYF